MSGIYALMDTLLPFEWLHYTFMKNALIAIVLLTPLFGMLGTMAVDNKMAFFSDALGHSALTGIAIGVVLGWQSQMSAMLLFGLIWAVLITFVKHHSKMSADTIISVFSSTSIALGLVVLSRGGAFAKYSSVLVGDVLSVAQGDLLALLLALVGTFFGCLIGFAVGALQTIPVDKQRDPVWKRVLLKILHIFLRCYVELFRGTPMIVQAVFIYYGLLQVFGIKMGMWQAGFFIVSINTGAYMAETVRGGIVSIDPGQTEGAKAIGMNHWQTMLHVIMPQALRNIIPQIGNNFIINIKDTSVLSVISITDLFFVHKSVVGALYTYFESAAIVMVIYLTMTLFASYLLRLWEKALDGPQNYDLNTTDSLAYTSGMYNAPDPNHESQNLDMKGGAAHV